MQALLDSVVTRLTAQLTYVHWVGVIDDELLPPESIAPPFVGVKDGGLTSSALPGRKDDERLTVHVIAYQGLHLDEPGASIMGSAAQLGAEGKGLLAIAADIKTALHDYVFPAYQRAYRDRLEPSRAIGNDQRLLSMQRNVFTYWRIV